LIKERQRQKEEMESKKFRGMNIIARLYFSPSTGELVPTSREVGGRPAEKLTG
jgi:hypothetical protein